MAGIADAGSGKRFLVDRRRHDRRRFPAADKVDRVLDRPRRSGAGTRVDVADRGGEQVGRKSADLEHRDATARQPRDVRGVLDRRHRKQPAGHRRGAPHDGDVTDHERTARLGGAEPRGDNLGADAACVAHRQGKRAAR